MFVRAVALLLAVTLMACSGPERIDFVPTDSANTTTREIFVATTRQADGPTDFSAKRTSRLNYARYDISIPPIHVEGKIEWPGRNPNPATDFVTKNVTPYDSALTFGRALNANAARNTDTAIIYVHGYNTSFAEGTYRLAQISHDMQDRNTVIHYSWPATENSLEYIRDRDSILFARDGLESLIKTVADQGFGNIVIVAHSVGSSLVTETLRQISLQSKSRLSHRIGGVILIAPDIDTDLFETQISRIDPMPNPFVVFGSAEDPALRLSAFLSGRANRVGQLKDTETLRRYGVQFVDVTDVKDGESGHSVAITSPTILSILRELPDPNRTNDVTVLQKRIDDVSR
ncbi:alpha/beta fold hydrolase [Amylibacter sp. IMCC11727]|uniref:alpha/beta hydrolase n=1 Tax=Amylibacter sp. IMCC11727 TaxID=3039851 RepID=UPI00244E3124|nr:alpha/beta fold hydrolase [Amylibacter sp. IMCC11727]WGI23553.1 alpha/beta hydrolase [Amylibacter sp. IMCC11727]